MATKRQRDEEIGVNEEPIIKSKKNKMNESPDDVTGLIKIKMYDIIEYTKKGKKYTNIECIGLVSNITDTTYEIIEINNIVGSDGNFKRIEIKHKDVITVKCDIGGSYKFFESYMFKDELCMIDSKPFIELIHGGLVEISTMFMEIIPTEFRNQQIVYGTLIEFVHDFPILIDSNEEYIQKPTKCLGMFLREESDMRRTVKIRRFIYNGETVSEQMSINIDEITYFNTEVAENMGRLNNYLQVRTSSTTSDSSDSNIVHVYKDTSATRKLRSMLNYFKANIEKTMIIKVEKNNQEIVDCHHGPVIQEIGDGDIIV